MKRLFILGFITCISVVASNAQEVQLIDSSYYSRDFVSYWQNNIAYNGKLYAMFYGENYEPVLVELNGDQLVEIPNPTGFNGGNQGYSGYPIVAHNNIYMSYRTKDFSNNYRSVLMYYNGTTLDSVPMPPNYKQYAGSPEVFGNMLYTRHEHIDGYFSLMKFDGVTMTEIETPQEYRVKYGGYLGHYQGRINSTFSDGKLIVQYRDENYRLNMFLYDGDSLIKLTNPIGYYAKVGFPNLHKIVNNNLYMPYGDSTGAGFLVKYNHDSLLIIEHPEAYNNLGLSGIVASNDSLVIMRYYHNDKSYTMFVYNGQELREIPSPIGYSAAYTGFNKIIGEFKGKQYFMYYSNNNSYDILAFDGNVLTKINNPAGFESNGFFSGGTVYQGKMILSYKHNNGQIKLFEFDGTNLMSISYPPNYSQTTSGYDNAMKIFHDKLYMKFIKDDGTTTLCIYDGQEIVEIENPTKENTDVYKGYTGDSYIFNDKLILSYTIDGELNRMFVLDETSGLTELSKSIGFDMFPNPANDFVSISGLKKGDLVRLYDLTGKLLTANSVHQTTFNINLPQAKGVYLVEVNRNGIVETKKLIKE
jgi:hypothetical protein